MLTNLALLSNVKLQTKEGIIDIFTCNHLQDNFTRVYLKLVEGGHRRSLDALLQIMFFCEIVNSIVGHVKATSIVVDLKSEL